MIHQYRGNDHRQLLAVCGFLSNKWKTMENDCSGRIYLVKRKKWGIIASFNNVIYKEKPHTGEIHEGRKTDRADLEKKDPQNGEKRTGGHLQYQ